MAFKKIRKSPVNPLTSVTELLLKIIITAPVNPINIPKAR